MTKDIDALERLRSEILENDKQRAIVAADMLYRGALLFHPASFRHEPTGGKDD